jgi:hypothetical protein
MSQAPANIRVKFLTKHPERDVTQLWRRFFPGGNTTLGRCQFIFDRDARNYDWIAVYDDLPSSKGERHSLWEEILACPRERTLLLTSEPATVKVYGRGFLNQFGWVLTSQEPWVIPHPGAIYCQTGLIWFYEGTHDEISQNPPTEQNRVDLDSLLQQATDAHAPQISLSVHAAVEASVARVGNLRARRALHRTQKRGAGLVQVSRRD